MRRHLRRRKALQARWLRRQYAWFQCLSDYTASMRGRQRHGARQAKLDDLKRVSFVHPTQGPDLMVPTTPFIYTAELIRMNEIGRIDSFRIITA